MKKYLLLFILIFFFYFHPAKADFSLVAQTASTSPSTLSFSLPITTPTAGNCLILGWASGNSTVTYLTSVSGGGVTWIRATDTSYLRSAEVWYGLNSTGLSSTITMTTIANSTDEVNISQWSGCPTSGFVEQYQRSRLNNATSTTATLTITNPKDLVYAMVRSNAASLVSGPGQGFTALASSTPVSTDFAYLLPGTLGSYFTTWVWNASISGDAVILALRPATTAPIILNPIFVFNNALFTFARSIFNFFSH